MRALVRKRLKALDEARKRERKKSRKEREREREGKRMRWEVTLLADVEHERTFTLENERRYRKGEKVIAPEFP